MTKLGQILKSRIFWAAMAALGFLVINAVLPDFPFSEAQVSGVVVVLGAYMLGEAIESAGTTSQAGTRLLDLVKSRKFWAAFAGVAGIFIKAYVPGFPFSEPELANLLYALAAFIVGAGIQDGAYGRLVR